MEERNDVGTVHPNELDSAAKELVFDSAAEELVLDSAPEELVFDSAAEELVLDSAPQELVLDSAAEELVLDAASDSAAEELVFEESTIQPSESDSFSRPVEYNTVVFTPEMIIPVQYDPSNFKPIIIDDVQVPESLIRLASYSPSFAPTPTKHQPPDGNKLHEDLMEYKRVLSSQ